MPNRHFSDGRARSSGRRPGCATDLGARCRSREVVLRRAVEGGAGEAARSMGEVMGDVATPRARRAITSLSGAALWSGRRMCDVVWPDDAVDLLPDAGLRDIVGADRIGGCGGVGVGLVPAYLPRSNDGPAKPAHRARVVADPLTVFAFHEAMARRLRLPSRVPSRFKSACSQQRSSGLQRRPRRRGFGSQPGTGPIAGWAAYVSATEDRRTARTGIAARISRDGFSRARRGGLRTAPGAGERHRPDAEDAEQRLAGTADRGARRPRPSLARRRLHSRRHRPPVARRTAVARTRTEDVVRSSILERSPDRMRVYMRLQRRKIVTATYNTEHVVTFTRFGATRAASISPATRIAEVSDPDTPDERELARGDDRGFLWRLNSYWRYKRSPAA